VSSAANGARVDRSGADAPPSCFLQNGRFIPDKSNVWRDSCDGYYDWVKEHINEVSEWTEFTLARAT